MRSWVAVAGIGVDEQRAAFSVGAARAGRRAGDEQHSLAGTGFAKTAPQRLPFGASPCGQPGAGLILSGCPDLLQLVRRDRLEDKRAGDRFRGHAPSLPEPGTLLLAEIGHDGRAAS